MEVSMHMPHRPAVSLHPCKILTEISARSRWVFGRRDCRDLGEISKLWWPKTRGDLKILPRFLPRSWWDLKISVAKNSPRISERFQVRSHQDIKILEAKKLTWQCCQDILKCRHSDPGELVINLLREVVSSRQNKYTEIRLQWLHVKNNQIHWQKRPSCTVHK